MYTNNNNSNNDKDGEEKRFTPLMIKKNNGHQNPPPHRRKKLELDKVLKVEILEIRLIASLIFNFFFCFAFQLTFLIAKRCHCSRKSMTNHFDISVKSFLFSSF